MYNKKNIYSTILILAALGSSVLFTGCGSSPPINEVSTTGFLSDYSGLKRISPNSRRYINPKYDLGNYSSFIIKPVELRFKEKTKEGIGNWDDLEKLKSYMRRTLIGTLEPRYTAVAIRPGPKIAIVRIALTNVEKSKPLRMGSVSMEMEVLDSVTGRQIAALVESQKKGVPFYGLYKWSGAKAVMDDWAKRFYNRLEETRGH